MFDQILKWAKLTAVLCVIPITVYLCLFLNSLRTTSDQLAITTKALPAQVDNRIEKLQTEVLKKIDTVQDNLNKEITTVATIADKRIDILTNTTDKRLASIQTDTFNSLNTTLNSQLTATNQSVSRLVDAYADIPKVVGARYERDFNSYFNCKTNQLCLQGQASDTMFAMRQSSRDTSTMMTGLTKTMPQIQNHMLTISNTFARDLPIMTTNIAGITQNINTLTKPKWYDRVLGYALNGVVIYRNMNPVTSLTVKGAQVISSQK